MNPDPAPPERAALDEARRRERLSHAEWRRRRAELARLVADGDEAAARALLAEAGGAAKPAAPAAPSRVPRAAASDPAILPAVAPKPSPKAAAKKSPPRLDVSPPAARAAKAPARRRANPRRRRTRAGWSEWLAARPPWATSLAVHGALLLAFGLMTFATLGDPGFLLSAALGEAESWDEAPVEIAFDAALDAPQSTEAAAKSMELEDAALALDAEVSLASLVEPGSLVDAALGGDVLALAGEGLAATVPGGAADARSGGGEGAPSAAAAGKVRFFGAESVARRVVFVVDNSGSMRDGRMETTLLELDNAVRGLSESQQFYVVFFSDQAYGMFFPEPIDDPLPATQPNKERLSRWLRTVEMCVGGRLIDAMEVAAGLEPEVVYLLTDGDIRSPYVAERLTTPGSWEFTLHTLGMGARTPQHVAILQAAAAATGGVYRPVGAHPRAVAMARQRPLPYHRTPGPVWGSAVQPWQ